MQSPYPSVTIHRALTHSAGIPSGSDFSLDHNSLGCSWSRGETAQCAAVQRCSALMKWSRAFTELILDFAARVAAVDGISLDAALLTATPLYPNFKLGMAFDASQPVWQEYLAGCHDAADLVAWTRAFYLAHARQYHPHPFGCFEYHYVAETRTAGLHFGNLDTSGLGALSRERRLVRMRELRALFTDLRRQHPEAETIQGGSWLYNLPAYRALFPPEYVATATPTRPGFTFLDVWGKFLDGHWAVRPEPAQSFRASLERAHSHADLEVSFPLWPLSIRGAIQLHYDFYGIERGSWPL